MYSYLKFTLVTKASIKYNMIKRNKIKYILEVTCNESG